MLSSNEIFLEKRVQSQIWSIEVFKNISVLLISYQCTRRRQVLIHFSNWIIKLIMDSIKGKTRDPAKIKGIEDITSLDELQPEDL